MPLLRPQVSLGTLLIRKKLAYPKETEPDLSRPVGSIRIISKIQVTMGKNKEENHANGQASVRLACEIRMSDRVLFS
jgi:hypothetical protein